MTAVFLPSVCSMYKKLSPLHCSAAVQLQKKPELSYLPCHFYTTSSPSVGSS